VLSHEATEGDSQKALKRINHLDVVAQDTVCIRVEGPRTLNCGARAE
jgi:hypothetical protein